MKTAAAPDAALIYYPAHPLAALLPMLSGTASEAQDLNDAATEPPPSEMEELVADLKAHGLREQMVRMADPTAPGGYLLVDGRNRQEALRRAGLGPQLAHYRDFDPDTDGEIFHFIVSANLRRRHLSSSQRAMAAARLAAWLREAKEQEKITSPAEEEGQPSAPVVVRRPKVADLPPGAKTRDVAAAAFSASPRLVQDALTIQQRGTERLRAAVDGGHLTVGAAVRVARLPTEHQDRVVQATETAATERLKTKALADGLRKIRGELRLQDHIAEAGGEEALSAAAAHPDIDLRCCDNLELVLDDGCPSFDLVHADPNWGYRNVGANGCPGHHYHVADDMRGKVLLLADVAERAPVNCYLLLWITTPMLAEWFEATSGMGERWSWRYISAGLWVKEGAPGSGVHWRGNGELLLLYAKGRPSPYDSQALPNTWVCPRTMHSEKPQGWLERLLPHFCPPGGRVLDLWAGLAPVARAARAVGLRYLGAELDPQRHQAALAALATTTTDTSADGDE